MRTKYSQMYYGTESQKSPNELLANGGTPAALETVPLSSKNTPPGPEHSIPLPYRHCEPPFNLSSAKERQSREKEESGQEPCLEALNTRSSSHPKPSTPRRIAGVSAFLFPASGLVLLQNQLHEIPTRSWFAKPLGFSPFNPPLKTHSRVVLSSFEWIANNKKLHENVELQ